MAIRHQRTMTVEEHFQLEENDPDEDIPGLLLGNTTLRERQAIAGWVQDALTHKTAWSSSERYEALLTALERVN